MLHLKLLKSSHWQSSNVEFIRRQLTTQTSRWKTTSVCRKLPFNIMEMAAPLRTLTEATQLNKKPKNNHRSERPFIQTVRYGQLILKEGEFSYRQGTQLS